MKMKNKDWILHWVLGIAIVISLGLMYVVVVNPFYTQRNEVKKTTTTSSLATANSRFTLSNVVWPTSIVENTPSGQYMATSLKISPVTVAKSFIQNWQLSNISFQTYTKKDYEKLLKSANYLVFNYADGVPILTAESLFSNQVKGKYETATINRVMVKTSGDARVYMLDDSTKKVYSFDVTNATNYTKLITNLNDASNSITQNAVYYYELNKRYRVGYAKPIKISNYSYLVHTDKVSNYLSRLLGSTVTTITNKSQYTDGSNQRINYDNKTNILTYSNYFKNKIVASQITLLQNSFTLLSKTNIDLDDVRYFDYDNNSKTIVYRTYIGEWPIIGDGSDAAIGTYTYRTNSNNTTSLRFSLKTLSVPVPTNGGTATLPATPTVFAKLKQAGYSLKSIHGVRIGFAISNNSTSKQVVDMTPAYYICINGKWQEYTTLLKARQ